MTTENTIGSGPKGMRRRAVAPTELVNIGPVPGNPGKFPLMITPAVPGVDLAGWCASHLDELNSYFDQYGAILFRGFDLPDAAAFEAVATNIAGDLFADYGDLPPESAGEKVYGSTPYPPDKMILFHNESAHLPTWPVRQFFFCVIPSQDRGTTPLIDCRDILPKLDPEVRAQFEQKGLRYVRNFSEGVDVPWEEFFKTDDKAEVERMCAEGGMTCEWTEEGLRISQDAPAVRKHIRTGEELFFNQIQLHHVSCLDEETRTALRQLFDEEDLPRNVYFGDGTPIPDAVMDRIGEIFEELCVEFPWEAQDLVAVDNMLISHARRPFSGPRKLLVAMGQMVNSDDLAGASA